MTGFEEPDLLNIQCEKCNNTGSIQIDNKWIDCKDCWHERYEKKFNLQKLGGPVMKRGVN